MAAMKRKYAENGRDMHGKNGGFCVGVLCDCFVVNGIVCMNALHGFIGREWMGEHVNGS